MNTCCSTKKKKGTTPKRKFDFILWGSALAIVPVYLMYFFVPEFLAGSPELSAYAESAFDLLNKMSWGLVLGIFFVGLLTKIPRELVSSALGKGGTIGGIFRATAAGVMLDLCSHGILLIGMKLYHRGASLGQVMAFLIASPWNSISLTLILWALVGFKWMMAFLLMSVVIAIVSGIIFDKLVARGVLPENPNKVTIPKDFKFFKEAKKSLKEASYHPSNFLDVLKQGVLGSRMILRWIFLGIVLASLIRTFVPPESFETLFGPTIAGLGMTVLVATVLEVCSEGSTPIAADILNRAGAPGNAFAFLMTGVSTDYTEMISLRETTKSWKIALFLPLVTVPQVLAISLIINYWPT